MFRLAWKSVKHNPKRLILTTVAIVLATSFVSGTFILTNGVQTSFNTMFTEIVAKLDIQVEPVTDEEAAPGFSVTVPSFDASYVDLVANVEGVEVVDGVVNGAAIIVDSEGKANVFGPPTLVMNWPNLETGLHNIELASGHVPLTAAEVVLDAGAAKRAGYEIGDTVTFNRWAESEAFEYTLVGLANFGESNGLNGASLAFLTYAEAEEFARQEGKVAAISVNVAEGYDVEEVRAAIQDALPDDAVAWTRQEVIDRNNAQITSFIDIMNTFILAFAVIAVFVGALLITNTFQTSVTQRTRELGLLRAIAASPRQILRLILLEGLLIGLLGSVLGLLVGYGGALVNKALLSAFADMGENLGALTVPWPAVVWGFVTGVGTTLVAATLPALHASRISPMEALRDEATRARKGLGTRETVGASMVVAAAIALALAFATDVWSAPGWVGIAGALLLVATILLIAGAIPSIATWLRPGARRLFGVNGTLAMNNARREPRRTANTAGALMIGVLLLTLMTTLSSSIKAAAQEQLVGTSSASFIVGGDFASDQLAPISADEIAAMRGADGVTTVHYYAYDNMPVDGKASDVIAIDAQTAESAFVYDTEPGFSELDPGEVYVSPAVLADGHAIGDSIEFVGPDSTLTLTIAGTYLTPGDPSYWITYQDGVRLHAGLAAIRVWIVTADDADTEEVRAALEAAVADNTRLEVLTTEEAVQDVNAMLNQVLALMAAMLSMALVIGVFGVANTLFLSVAERTREIGLLRAVGVGRKAIRRMFTIEAVFISILGAVGGFILGVGIATALVYSIDAFSDYGVTIPWADLVGYTVMAVFAGIFAAMLPARRAAKLDILKAVATD